MVMESSGNFSPLIFSLLINKLPLPTLTTPPTPAITTTATLFLSSSSSSFHAWALKTAFLKASLHSLFLKILHPAHHHMASSHLLQTCDGLDRRFSAYVVLVHYPSGAVCAMDVCLVPTMSVLGSEIKLFGRVIYRFTPITL